LKSENVGKFIGPHVILAQIFSALSLSIRSSLVAFGGDSWAAGQRKRKQLGSQRFEQGKNHCKQIKWFNHELILPWLWCI
jgi:hypothetical protein